MDLSKELVSQFVKVTNDNKSTQSEASLFGSIVMKGDTAYVRIDGSELLTPINTTAKVNDGDRVIVRLKNHMATVTGNITSPSTGQGELDKVVDQITEFEIIIADRIDANEIKVGSIITDNIEIRKLLTATNAEIENLKAENVEITGKLEANEAEIEDLKVKKLDAETADIKFATIENLKATNIEVNNIKGDHAEFSETVTEKLEAIDADIKNLDAEKLSADEADIKYANIDFANIDMAAVGKIFADSGIIKDIVIGDGQITGELVGVTIKGDLIEANTLVADKLVVKGEDGLYYKLNVDGMKVESEQTEYNSLNGSIITAKSITATKISVNDLVAFDATIGGFNISSNSIYSGVKTSVDNTTKGIYLDKDGQIAFGDSNNYLKFFRDTDDSWKLMISANSLKFSTSDKTVEEVIDDIDNKVQKTVKTVIDYYASSSNPTTKPTTGWQTTPPAWVNGMFTWAKTKTTYTDETSSESEPVCITGAKGDTGKPGADGNSGIGISSVDVEYYLSTSSTTLAGGSWSTNAPTWADGKYMWSRTKTTTTDGKSTISDPVCITGGKGSTGSNGSVGQGVESITEEYYLSTSKTTQSGGSWVTTPPTWSSGKYLWTRSKIVYKNPTETSYTKPVCDNSWEAVNEIEIGGRNLILDSSDAILTSKNATNKLVSLSDDILDVVNASIGKPFILSVDIEVDNCIGSINSGNQRIGAEVSFKLEDNTYVYIGCWGYPSVGESISRKRIYGKPTVIRKKVVSVNSAGLHNQVVCNNSTISKPKFEMGNKPTDWSPAPEDAINDLTIGGSNLLKNSDFSYKEEYKFWHDNTDGISKVIIPDTSRGYESYVKLTTNHTIDAGLIYDGVFSMRVGEKLTLSLEVNTSDSIKIGIAIDGGGLANGKVFTISETDKWITLKETFTFTGTNPAVRIYCANKDGVTRNWRITHVKLERGKYATSWSKHPDDYIEEVSSLQDIMNGAFKDNVLSESEKKAIKQSLNIIKGDAEEVQKQYDTVYNNSNLIGTPKSNLLNAKTSYNSAYNSLISFINTALSASTVTDSMIASIDSAFGTYRTALGAFNTRLQEAIDSINSKKVDDIEVGGRNLLLKSNVKFNNSDYSTAKYYFGNEKLSEGEEFTIQIKGKLNSSKSSFSIYNSGGSVSVLSLTEADNKNGIYTATGKWIITKGGSTAGNTHIIVYAIPSSVTAVSSIDWIKIEKGNKATDWTPAPEDIDSKITVITDRVTEAESQIEQTNTAITNKVWQTDIDKTIVEVNSRGENLVTNGNGSYKDNTNFTNWSYAGNVRGISGLPSFKKGSPYLCTNDEYIYVDTSKDYRLSYELCAEKETTQLLYGVVNCFDIDKKVIGISHVLYIKNTLTTLAKDLKPGDTVVYFNDLTNWKVDSSTPDYQRGFIFWNYKDSTGYLYPPETYSRNAYSNRYTDSSKVNKTAKTITLSSAWNGGTIPAGTKVSQCDSGPTYVYVGISGIAPTTQFKRYDAPVISSKFRPGTVSVTVGLMGSAPVYISNIHFGLDKVNSSDLSTVTTEVTNIKKRTATLETGVEGITSKVTKLETTTSTINGEIKDHETRIQTTEQKVTASGVITTIQDGINSGKNSLNTMQFILDKNGATIKNGALRILNKAGSEVLKGDTDGNLGITGILNVLDTQSKKSVAKLSGHAYTVEGVQKSTTSFDMLGDWIINSADNNKDIFGHVNNVSIRRYKNTVVNRDFLELRAGYNVTIHGNDTEVQDTSMPGGVDILSYYKGSDGYVSTNFISVSGKTISLGNNSDEVKIKAQADIILNKYIEIDSVFRCIKFKYDDLYKNGVFGRLATNAVQVGNYKYGDVVLLGRRGSNPNPNAYCVMGQLTADSDLSYYRTIEVASSGVSVTGNFKVSGTKNRIVENTLYGDILMNAYETTDSWFGDLGRGVIDENGISYVYFDPVFLATVNTKFDYNVFLQKYGPGDLWVDSREEDHFVVKGTPNLEFSWEAKCKQLGYEVNRTQEEYNKVTKAVYVCESSNEDTIYVNDLINKI